MRRRRVGDLTLYTAHNWEHAYEADAGEARWDISLGRWNSRKSDAPRKWTEKAKDVRVNLLMPRSPGTRERVRIEGSAWIGRERRRLRAWVKC